MGIYADAGLRWACLLLLLAVPAGAQEDQTAKEEQTRIVASGFLGDLSELEPHPNRPKQMLVWKERPGVLAEYDRFLVEHPLVFFHPESRAGLKGIDPQELHQLTKHLSDSVVAALEKGGFEVVDTPGEGVLIIRSAITDVDPVNPAANMGTKTAGLALGVGLFVPRADLGRAAIEVEFLDGESERRVAAVAAANKPRRFGGVIKGAKRWGDVRAAFDKWANQFRKQLETARGGG